MRITEFAVEKYGPLKSTGRVEPGDFNLFYGKNENGKTLSIDALIKFLIGKRTKDFDRIDRVSDMPDGYLKLEINGGLKMLPYDGDLPKITKVFSSPLSPSDCRNIFIIRNSDLTLSGERDFYTGVTDRLVGLRTFDIKKIKRSLLEMGRLTPSMDFKDDEKSLRLKTRFKKAEDLVPKIEGIKERLHKGRYDALEMDLYKKTEELSSINGMIAHYEDARKREMLEKSSALLSGLEAKINSLKDMEIFGEEDFALWQDSAREIKRLLKEQSELKEKLNEIGATLSHLETESKDLKDRLNILNNKKKHIDDERINIRRLEEQVSEIESDSTFRNLFKRISVFSSILTLVIIATWFFNPSVYAYAAGILFLLISAVLWFYEVYLNKKKKKPINEFGQIKSILAGEGINGNSIEEILNAIGRFGEDYEKMKIKSMECESRLSTAERHLKETEQKISDIKSQINGFEKRIFSLKTKSGLESLDEYSEKLKLKKSSEKERDGIINRVEGMLGVHAKSAGEALAIIKAKIHELEPFRERAGGIEFDEYKYNDLKNKSKTLEEMLKTFGEKKSQFETGMSQIEAEANDIFPASEERLYCKTLIDLDEVLARLTGFVKENKEKRSAITCAAEILDDIGREETERVVDLFDDNLSGLFKTITGGKYSEVIYDKEAEGAIRVTRSTGEQLSAEKLSGGAYDQLYLSVRIALGEKILQTEKGFFIMDDPFIKSDTERIEAQMNALKKIRDTGWQILYFTCKNEIKDVLSEDIKEGNVKYFEIKWLG